jgi:hypothetical protein
MTFLNKFMDKLVSKPIIVDTPPNELREPPMISIPARIILKPGKWVMVQGEIGLVSQLLDGDQIVVDMVNVDDGTTRYRKQISIALCTLARWAEIPECRKIGFSREDAFKLGYF